MHEFKGTLYNTMEDPQTDLTNVSFLFNHFHNFYLILYMIETFEYRSDAFLAAIICIVCWEQQLFLTNERVGSIF